MQEDISAFIASISGITSSEIAWSRSSEDTASTITSCISSGLWVELPD
jgi:hypothetical protein